MPEDRAYTPEDYLQIFMQQVTGMVTDIRGDQDTDFEIEVDPLTGEPSVDPDQFGGGGTGKALGRVAPQTSGNLSWGNHENGRIPDEALEDIGGGHMLESQAAAAWRQMAEDAAKEGITLDLTDSYRSYDAQVDVKRRKPRLAAKPGTSNHGWGRAIDVRSPEARRWVQQNGARYGWIWPSWAQPGGSKPEDWHFEFNPGGGASQPNDDHAHGAPQPAQRSAPRPAPAPTPQPEFTPAGSSRPVTGVPYAGGR